jgi:outer membrane protein assembly factor BamB
MSPVSSRRRVLTACGAILAPLSGARALVDNTTSNPNRRADAHGWPMEQYDPGGTSYASSATGPKTGISVRWKQPVETNLGFAYHPTPVVTDGLVYGVGQELVCIDAASGAVVFRVDRRYGSPPAVAAARAYRSPTLAVATPSGAVGLNAHGGIPLAGSRFGLTRWEAGREERSLPLFRGRSVQIPVAADGMVFAIAGDGLVAIDASSGRVQWRGHDGLRRPAVRTGTVFIAAYTEGVLGYDIDTGKRTFSAALSEQAPRSVTATAERLVVSTSDGLFGVTYDGKTDWRYTPENLSRDGGAVAVADNVAYAGFRGEPNRLVAIDATTGTELWRSKAAPEATPQFAPPAVADGVVYLPLEDGGLAGIDAADGHIQWRFTPGNQVRPWSPVALAGETLYALGNGHLYALVEA